VIGRSFVAPASWRSFVFFLATTASLTANAQESCLDNLKAGDGSPQFDLAHDLNAQGDSFSCDVEVRASTALSVLEAFRYGFHYDSRPHLERSIRFPLKVTVSKGDTADGYVVMVKNVTEWLKFKANHFDPYERAMIACANLANVRIYKKWSGFSIGFGQVWFFNSVNFGLRVGQINITPMTEEQFRRACVVDRSVK
jgi:hypothetical protein